MNTEHQKLIDALLVRRARLADALQAHGNPATAAAADARVVDIGSNQRNAPGRTQLTVELARVEAALSRHAKGAFGLCCSCELDVEPERLAADPTVAFCEACFEEVAEERRRQGYVVR